MTWYRALAHKIQRDGGLRKIVRKNTETGKLEDYLWRYYIHKGPHMEIMLHRFWQGDVGPLHDHPWRSFGRILYGGYWEYVYEGDILVKHWRGPGHIGGRSATAFHKVELEPGTEGNVWTLFCTMKRQRMWGFDTLVGWQDFETFQKAEGSWIGNSVPENYSQGWFPKRIED